MRRSSVFSISLLILFPFYLLMISCGDPDQGLLRTDTIKSNAEVNAGQGDIELGVALYNQHCASCHNPFENSQKKYEGPQTNLIERTRSAISVLPVMQHLSSLSESDINLITLALTTDAAEATTSVELEHLNNSDGVRLYQANCASCHGSLDTSTKLGRSFDAINQAIEKEPSMALTRALTLDERKLIAEVLNQKAAIEVDSSNGAKLYKANCASCHGVLLASTKLDRSADTIKSAISNINSMKYLQTLSKDQIEDIAKALSTKDMAGGSLTVYTGLGGVKLLPGAMNQPADNRSHIRTFSSIRSEFGRIFFQVSFIDKVKSSFPNVIGTRYEPMTMSASNLITLFQTVEEQVKDLHRLHKDPSYLKHKKAYRKATDWYRTALAGSGPSFCENEASVIARRSLTDDERNKCIEAYAEGLTLHNNEKKDALMHTINTLMLSTIVLSY